MSCGPSLPIRNVRSLVAAAGSNAVTCWHFSRSYRRASLASKPAPRRTTGHASSWRSRGPDFPRQWGKYRSGVHRQRFFPPVEISGPGHGGGFLEHPHLRHGHQFASRDPAARPRRARLRGVRSAALQDGGHLANRCQTMAWIFFCLERIPEPGPSGRHRWPLKGDFAKLAESKASIEREPPGDGCVE